MANTATARVDRTPTHNDLEITHLVHRALADVQDGRVGNRKVFIATSDGTERGARLVVLSRRAA